VKSDDVIFSELSAEPARYGDGDAHLAESVGVRSACAGVDAVADSGDPTDAYGVNDRSDSGDRETEDFRFEGVSDALALISDVGEVNGRIFGTAVTRRTIALGVALAMSARASHELSLKMPAMQCVKCDAIRHRGSGDRCIQKVNHECKCHGNASTVLTLSIRIPTKG
jgi:hypothetical protein